MDLQSGRRWEGDLMRWHWEGQWEQLGREGGEQGRRKERREHVAAETRKGVAERLMGRVGMKEEGQLGWGVGLGRGERVMEEVLEL